MKTIHKVKPEEFPVFFGEDWFDIAIEELRKGKYSKEERIEIERALIREASYQQSMKEEKEYSKKEGEKKGKKEEREEIVIKMIQEGFELSVISKVTGLSLSKIKQIQKEMGKHKK